MSDAPQVHWHERSSVLSWLRRRGRSALFRLVERLFATDDGRSVLAAASAGLAPRRVRLPPPVSAPYRELGTAAFPIEPEPGRQPPIFITARFRSGSTFLWNLFRRIDGYTSYYEPHQRATLVRSADAGRSGRHHAPARRGVLARVRGTRRARRLVPRGLGPSGTSTWTNPSGRPRCGGTSSS